MFSPLFAAPPPSKPGGSGGVVGTEKKRKEKKRKEKKRKEKKRKEKKRKEKKRKKKNTYRATF
jgi:hypothetical protein